MGFRNDAREVDSKYEWTVKIFCTSDSCILAQTLKMVNDMKESNPHRNIAGGGRLRKRGKLPDNG